jgi:hypothetical protein
MPEPGNNGAERPAGRMRTSRAEREQVVDILKDAFVEDRLTKDEFDSRVGGALASRTHADLNALTADLPASQLPRRPTPARPGRPENMPIKTGARVIAVTTVLTGSVWAGALFSNTDSQAVGMLVTAITFLWLGIVMMMGSVMLETHLSKRSGGQLPPSSRDGGRASGRARSADPARPLRPGDHVAEASRKPTSRLSLLLEPRLNPC